MFQRLKLSHKQTWKQDNKKRSLLWAFNVDKRDCVVSAPGAALKQQAHAFPSKWNELAIAGRAFVD